MKSLEINCRTPQSFPVHMLKNRQPNIFLHDIKFFAISDEIVDIFVWVNPLDINLLFKQSATPENRKAMLILKKNPNSDTKPLIDTGNK